MFFLTAISGKDALHILDSDGLSYMGVLLTLIVLCVLVNNNNFIVGLLRNIALTLKKLHLSKIEKNAMSGEALFKDKFGNSHKEVEAELKSWSKERNAHHLKDICVKSYSDFEKNLTNHRARVSAAKAYKEYLKAMKKGDTIWSGYLDTIFNPAISNRIKIIEKDVTRQASAPFYSLLFGLLVLGIDVLLFPLINSVMPDECKVACDLALVFLWCVTILSFVYWFDKWLVWMVVNGEEDGKISKLVARWSRRIIRNGGRLYRHSLRWFRTKSDLNDSVASSLPYFHKSLRMAGIVSLVAWLASLLMHNRLGEFHEQIRSSGNWLGWSALIFVLVNGVVLPFYVPNSYYKKYFDRGITIAQEDTKRAREHNNSILCKLHERYRIAAAREALDSLDSHAAAFCVADGYSPLSS